MYLKGIGVKKDLRIASELFMLAANAGQPKAFYQLAKMFHTGVGLKKNLIMVNSVYFIFFLFGLCICFTNLIIYLHYNQASIFLF